MDFFGLLHVPGVRRWRRRAPVRASCRPDTALWTVPPVLPASVPRPFSKDRRSSLRPGSGPSLRPPHPAATYRRRSRRAPHRSGTAAMILVLPFRSRTKRELRPTHSFSDNQKWKRRRFTHPAALARSSCGELRPSSTLSSFLVRPGRRACGQSATPTARPFIPSQGHCGRGVRSTKKTGQPQRSQIITNGIGPSPPSAHLIAFNLNAVGN